MENSRHEKVMIIIAAWVIGFVTAYIAYGITRINEQYPTTEVVKVNSVAEVQQQLNNRPALEEDELGLYFKTAESRRLLTANQAALASADPTAITKPTNGEYYEVYGMSVSPNAKFAYFCEQLRAADTTCEPFVYDVAADALHRVELSDGRTTLPISDQKVSWGEQGKLFLSDFKSSSFAEPWH